MAEPALRFFVGVGWATQAHAVRVADAARGVLAGRSVEHSGAGLAGFLDWLGTLTAAPPEHVAVGIETPRGAPTTRTALRQVAPKPATPGCRIRNSRKCTSSVVGAVAVKLKLADWPGNTAPTDRSRSVTPQRALSAGWNEASR